MAEAAGGVPTPFHAAVARMSASTTKLSVVAAKMAMLCVSSSTNSTSVMAWPPPFLKPVATLPAFTAGTPLPFVFRMSACEPVPPIKTTWLVVGLTGWGWARVRAEASLGLWVA